MRISKSAAIEAEAAAWIARLDGQAVTPADRAEFQVWSEQSNQHRKAAMRLSALWAGLDGLREALLPPPTGANDDPAQQRDPSATIAAN